VDASVIADLNLRAQWATELIEDIAETQFVERSTTALAEIHDLAVPQGFLQLRRRPIIGTVAVVIGDPGTTALLDTTYHVDAVGGQILLKASSANPRANRKPPSMFEGNPNWIDFPEDYFSRYGIAFPAIPHSAVVTYRGGYVNTAAVPGELKRVAGNILARWYREEERKSQGLTSEVAQGLTYATKFDNRLVNDEDRRYILAAGNLSRTAREIARTNAVGTITGTVVDSIAAPVSGATVLACPSGLTATTAVNGTYSIAGVPVGDVVVKAGKVAVGFKLAAGTVIVAGIVVDLALTLPYQAPGCS
jgi:hypothetical protein